MACRSVDAVFHADNIGLNRSGRTSSGASVSGRRNQTHTAITTASVVRKAKIQCQSAMAITACPRLGARMGTIMNTRNTMLSICAIRSPDVRSRMMAVATTPIAAPTRPWTNRATSRLFHSGASAENSAATIYPARLPKMTRRRPNRSAKGPWINEPTPRPIKYRVMTRCCALGFVAPKDRAISGSAGSIESIASAFNAINIAIMATNSRPLSAGRAVGLWGSDVCMAKPMPQQSYRTKPNRFAHAVTALLCGRRNALRLSLFCRHHAPVARGGMG